MKLQAILIDDENHCNQTLNFELKRNCPQVEVVDMCLSAEQGMKSISEHQPDLVFLDIEMPGMSGIEMVNRIDKIDFAIIFVTAYDQYAIKAFRLAAIDYLLKPIVCEDLVQAVERVLERKSPVSIVGQVKTLVNNLEAANSREKLKVALPTRDGLQFVPVGDICRCEADSNYSEVFLINGKSILLAKTLKDLESLLEYAGFFRCHQSHIIRLEYVDKYIKKDGGYLVLEDGKTIPVSKRKKEECLRRLKNM